MLIAACVGLSSTARAFYAPFQDTSRRQGIDTLKYPLHDRRGDKFTFPQRNSFGLKDPANISDSIIYDPKTKQYYIIEKIGDFYYRKPTYLTFEEFMDIMARKQEDDYFQKRANILSSLNRKMLKPQMSMTDNLFNRIFGNGKIEIKPQGEVNIIAGYQGQNIKNPALPERARRSGGFDFDMNANLSVIGNIGDKLKLPISYNTLANFDFDNQLKLDYTGSDDEIIKKIEAGNVSFSSKGTLITGAQQLFGVKTQLQFGKLFVTGVLANQRSQKQSLALTGGSANTYFEFKADDYEENRHFLLAQYFRNNYNKAMAKLPVVNSQVQILRVEVWVTNRNGSTTETRDVVGLMDLGEINPYNQNIHASPGNGLPGNDVNDIYRRIINDPNSRSSSYITSKLQSLGLNPVQDFEKTFARKLNPTDFFFNPQIGFISINQPLQPDEVLGVAYQYSYNGRIYQVGEFSQDVPPDTTVTGAGTQKVLFLKLLKATSQRTNLPLWNLMMKNVYTLKTKDGSYLSGVQPADFKLNVLYEEPSNGEKRFLPEGDKPGVPLITLLNLDRLNARNDPLPDGVFDYLEGFTIQSQQARVIFPFLEPFGRDLDSVAFANSTADLKQKYVYYPLYDTIKEIAKTYANLDRYVISGYAKGQSTSEISLGAFNVPQGSVSVTAGGQVLVENVDYVIDYNLGTVKIINQAILNAGLPVNVQFENNAGYGIQQRNFMALRLDYLAKQTATEQLTIGATMERLGERPFFTKTSYNEDPIRNTMYGVDFNYMTQAPRLTHWLDKLPFYHTTEMSTITAYGEAAYLKPGHPPQIGKGSESQVFIDDFEGAQNAIDLRFPLVSWGLASTPAGNGLFPEATMRDTLQYGYNRAKLAWYNIEPVLQDKTSPDNPINKSLLADPRVRSVAVTDIFPNQQNDLGQQSLVTFDMAYYPTERGPYNFDARPGSIDGNGRLLNPQKRWGGIMRGLDQTDFETNNIEVIEFWLQDPYILNPNSTGGELYFNLGNISEDVLKDGKRFFENGISGAATTALEDTATRWGKVPANPIQVTQAFSNDPSDRPLQDAGFDGLVDDAEQVKFQGYLSQLQAVAPGAVAKASQDPSSDDYVNYRDARFSSDDGILIRYKDINNPQGNSPVASSSDKFVSAFTLYPDQEEFNRDNTLNELEEYFQYKVELKKDSMKIGINFITDSVKVTPKTGGPVETWYQFRIPISQFTTKVGTIPDFKSIRFIRMFLSGFQDSVVLRFAELQLVRNQWRTFSYLLDTTSQYVPIPPLTTTTVKQLAVNINQNSSRLPVPYVTPPGVVRQQQLSNNNVNLLQNEQALSLQVCNLAKGDARGVFKTLSLDLRQYKQLQMYVHAESSTGSGDIKNGDLYAVVRLGNDLISNFYEIKIPLNITPWNTVDPEGIWPADNNLQLSLDRLTALKVSRNNNGNTYKYYQESDANGTQYSILGNPNLGEIQSFFIGVQNANRPSACAEIWFNELRLSGLDEHGAWAATGRVDIKLADLGTLYFSGTTKTAGWGSIDQRVNERSREAYTQMDAAANLELGKLLPAKAGISIPVYASYSQTVTTPEYDPYDLDIKLKDKLNAASGAVKDSIRNDAIDVKTIKTVNFTNVKKNNTTGKKQQIWSIENFDLSYSYYKEQQHNPLIESNSIVRHRAGLGYNYTSVPKYWEPVKGMIKTKSPWVAAIKDFNINPLPTLLGFRADVNRQMGIYRPRSVGTPKDLIPETYDKYFTFDRTYNLRWDFTRSLNLDFTALNRAWVDEDSGRLDEAEKKRMWHNFWKGGRTIEYNHKATVSYTFPTSKIPFLDWTTVRAGYSATFDWLGASLIAREMGNTLSNTQSKNLTAELDFTRLYAKSRLLRAFDEDIPASQGPPVPGAGKKTDSTGKKIKRDKNAPLELSGAAKFGGRLLTMLKRVNVQYSENASATIYGFTDSTHILGMNFKSMAPGLGFIFGRQPDTNFVNMMAQKGWLTADSNFNYQNRQDYQQKLNITATLIPVRDLTIDLTLDKTFGKMYSELYKDTTGTGANFARLNPYTSGSFSVSYIAFKTMFTPVKANEVTSTFLKFQDYRYILSQRLAVKNPYWQGLDPSKQFTPDGYYTGYGRYAQDVLIPAFLAAYTGKNPSDVPLIKQDNPNIRSNPFSGILPRPNWRLTYNGLSRIKGLDKIFTNVTISHGYTGTLSMNSFTSNLLYTDSSRLGFPSFIDTLTGNYIPYFLVPNISISEQFVPLIDVDMQFTNQLTARFEYKKSRTVSLSLIDFQLSESRSTEFTIGAGFRKRGAFSWIKFKGKPLQNDASFRLDVGLRDDITANSRLDQDQALPTNGQKVITINPTIDYVISNRVNLKLYFEQRRTEPKVSTSPPITTTRAGLQLRISLAQ